MDTLVYMRFHAFLEMMLGSKVKVKLLRAFCKYKGKEFTLRELGRLLRVSHAGVSKAIVDLEKMNVVTLRVIGRSNVYSLNKESYTSRIAMMLFRMEEQALEELVKMLKRAMDHPTIISCVIFGSIVRGSETASSDIDLLVIAERSDQAEDVVVRAQREVTNKFGSSLSPYYISPKEFERRRNSALIKGIIQNHILLHGRLLGE